ncbi:MAG: hypothetical protein HRF50_10040 [Phycisphaerae bacterium]|jgi:16S rRNA (cytosine967-C5)-methyltransferase
MLTGREAARLAVIDALRGARFVAETLRGLRAQGRLAARESALAMETALGAVRHQVTLDHVLKSVADYDPARVRDELRAALHCAAYQVVWMDRVPLFAAVDETVELTRRTAGRRAAGMVNAILRALCRAVELRRTAWRRLDPRLVRVNWSEACRFDRPVLPEAELAGAEAHVAAAAAERLSRFQSLVRRFGSDAAEEVTWASQATPVTVLLPNRLQIEAAAYQRQIREEFGDAVECTPHAAFLPGSARLADSALFREGRAYVQDLTQRFAASLLEARPGERILDLCAAPGGKSVALALDMEDRGEIVACDAGEDRIELVRENARRMHLTCIRTRLIQHSDASDIGEAPAFDGAIVDVPCTNTGAIARRPEARLALTSRKLASLRRLQTALLRRAAAVVRAGGRLVYSTCSIEPEENERIVMNFLRENSAWSLEHQQTTLPAWGAQLSAWRDGGYAARLVRTA